MDTEFHYYLTVIIARAAGFSEQEARTIGEASEFTDENDVIRKVRDRSSGEIYANYISQTMNILKPKHDLMRIYPIFHFVPGDPTAKNAARRDGKMHLLNTTPDNQIANEVLDEALRVKDETRLYRIGIATHAYADTWAHQNFVGWYDCFNSTGINLKPISFASPNSNRCSVDGGRYSRALNGCRESISLNLAVSPERITREKLHVRGIM